nr:unnamed protein product [Callosobruchus chinensis]
MDHGDGPSYSDVGPSYAGFRLLNKLLVSDGHQPKSENLSELVSLTADNPRDETILKRIKDEVIKHLPDGWENWTVCPLSKEDILGEDPDHQVLNRIRFAIPTVGMAHAFHPNSTYISERSLREMKLKMLEWAFYVGLIVGPSAIANRIRGSAAQNELILAAIRDLKPLMLSRKEANKIMGNEPSESESNPTRSRKGSKVRETGRISTDHENRLDRVESMVSAILEKLNSREHVETPMETNTDEEGSELPSEDDLEEARSWAPPNLLAEMEEEDTEIDFRPLTKEQEPPIPTVKPNILQQGRECQRLGTSSFNRIRYADVHKKLHASPVFSSLKVNPQLPPTLYLNQLQVQLAKSDSCLGTILHGMLLQREAFSNTINEIVRKHPGTRSDILKSLVREGDFRQLSDDLIQYVCGRRAEIIDQRRKIFRPKNDYAASLLEKIPPSDTHLFDDQLFDEFHKQHGRFFRPLSRPSISRNYRSETTARTDSRQRRPPTKDKAQASRGAWRNHSGSYRGRSSTSGVHKSYKKGGTRSKPSQSLFDTQFISRRSPVELPSKLDTNGCSKLYPKHLKRLQTTLCKKAAAGAAITKSHILSNNRNEKRNTRNGLTWDTDHGKISLPTEKKESISQEISKILKTRRWSWIGAKSLLGKLNFASMAIPLGRLRSRNLQRASSLLPERRPRKTFPIPEVALEACHWWKDHLNTTAPLFQKNPSIFMTTDASDRGWGAQLGHTRLQKTWKEAARLALNHSGDKEDFPSLGHPTSGPVCLKTIEGGSSLCNPRQQGYISTVHQRVQSEVVIQAIEISKPQSRKKSIWSINVLVEWMRKEKIDKHSLFQVSRRVALILLLASGRRIHDLTLLRVDNSSMDHDDESISFWPEYGSKTDKNTHRQSGWRLLKASDTSLDPIFWINQLILVTQKRRTAVPNLNHLFITSRGKVSPASRTIIAGWVKTAFVAAGICFPPGSIRSAVASARWDSDVPLDTILKKGNWKGSTNFFNHYFKEVDRTVSSPTLPVVVEGIFMDIP